MKVHGMVDPGSFTVEQIPGTNRSLVRLFQNVEPLPATKPITKSGWHSWPAMPLLFLGQHLMGFSNQRCEAHPEDLPVSLQLQSDCGQPDLHVLQQLPQLSLVGRLSESLAFPVVSFKRRFSFWKLRAITALALVSLRSTTRRTAPSRQLYPYRKLTSVLRDFALSARTIRRSCFATRTCIRRSVVDIFSSSAICFSVLP